MLKLSGYAVRVLMGAYALSVSLFLILRVSVGESWEFVALINDTVHVLVLPALFLLPLALLIKKRDLVGMLLLPFAASLMWYVPAFIPSQPAAAASDETFSVMTFNLLVSIQNPEEFERILREADADVVALQELNEENADYFAEHLADLYPAQSLHPDPTMRVAGVGILSKYPILESSIFKTVFNQQRALIDFNGTPVAVYSVHPVAPFSANGIERRGRDVATILDHANHETVPVIIAGDFNFSPYSGGFKRMTAKFEDSHTQAGYGLGFTHKINGIPVNRIDYVFFSPDWQAVESIAWAESGGSDHRPVRAELVFVGTD